MDYIKTEFKKLGSISLIIVGTFLITEHIYTYGSINLWDILGHEWMGIILILLGILFSHKNDLTLDELKEERNAKINFIFGVNGKS